MDKVRPVQAMVGAEIAGDEPAVLRTGRSRRRDAGPVTTVTLEKKDGKTRVVLSERYPAKEALDAAGTGAQEALHETFGQLDERLITLGAE